MSLGSFSTFCAWMTEFAKLCSYLLVENRHERGLEGHIPCTIELFGGVINLIQVIEGHINYAEVATRNWDRVVKRIPVNPFALVITMVLPFHRF